MNIRHLLLAATFLAAPFAARAETISGVYVGLGAGANFENSSRVDSVRVGGTSIGLGKLREKFDTGFRTSAFLGYGFGNGLRAEIEGTFFQNSVSRLGVFQNGGGIGGSNFVPSPTRASGDRQKYGGFLNVLYRYRPGPVRPRRAVHAVCRRRRRLLAIAESERAVLAG